MSSKQLRQPIRSTTPEMTRFRRRSTRLPRSHRPMVEDCPTPSPRIQAWGYIVRRAVAGWRSMARSCLVRLSFGLSSVESVSRMPRCAKPRPVPITLHYTPIRIGLRLSCLSQVTIKPKSRAYPGFCNSGLHPEGRYGISSLLFARIKPQA